MGDAWPVTVCHALSFCPLVASLSRAFCSQLGIVDAMNCIHHLTGVRKKLAVGKRMSVERACTMRMLEIMVGKPPMKISIALVEPVPSRLWNSHLTSWQVTDTAATTAALCCKACATHGWKGAAYCPPATAQEIHEKC